MTKEEKRNARRADRAARKEKRQARRSARRAARQGEASKLTQFLAGLLQKSIDHEVAKISYERGDGTAPVLDDPMLLTAGIARDEVMRAMNRSNIPIFSKLAGVVTDVTEGFQKQVRVASSVAKQHNYQGPITTELMMLVIADSVSKVHLQADLGLITADKVYVKGEDEDLKKTVMKKLAGAVVSRLLKSVVARYVPVLGTALSVMWNDQATRNAMLSAAGIFSKEVVVTDDIPATTSTPNTPDIIPEEDEDEDFERIYTILGLIMQDGVISPSERGLFDELLKNANLNEEDKADLRNLMADFVERDDIDLSNFKNDPEDAFLLMADLIAMAKADSNFATVERKYIINIGREVGIPPSTIERMLV